MIETILLILSCLACLAYLGFKAKREVHIMQQNAYFISRYSQWWTKNIKLAFAPAEIAALGIGILAMITQNSTACYSVFILIFVAAAYSFYKDKPKKALVFTPRAKRLLGTMLLINILLVVLINWFLACCPLTCMAILAISSFAVLILASSLLLPVENSINQGFVDDAKKRLRSMPDLKVIGITGSYGKTSVKHFVARILAEKYNVLHTPGSVNTTLGVVRIIREQLKPTHEVFIAEMGAKKMGDVAEICELTRPNIAILTAVGPEHLDTFGTIENVQQGNFELPRSLSGGDSFAILNADYELVKAYSEKNTNIIFYGVEDTTAEYAGKNLQYTATGMTFDFYKKGEKMLSLETKLLGTHNVSNIVSACAVAWELDVEPAKIAFAVRNLQPVQHRLEIKRNPGGITIIDDAFNSNPTGARMAVEVLGKVQGNKKIIVTPGMIELAAEEYAYNKAFGKQIAAVCDYVVLVGPKQTIPIQDGLREAGYPEAQLYIAKHLNDAIAHLRGVTQIGDVVLYENDLPDTYNE